MRQSYFRSLNLIRRLHARSFKENRRYSLFSRNWSPDEDVWQGTKSRQRAAKQCRNSQLMIDSWWSNNIVCGLDSSYVMFGKHTLRNQSWTDLWTSNLHIYGHLYWFTLLVNYNVMPIFCLHTEHKLKATLLLRSRCVYLPFARCWIVSPDFFDCFETTITIFVSFVR